MIQKSLAYLGLRGRDRVTGFEGVVLSVIFYIEENIQVLLTPPMDKDGKLPDQHQFDINRIEIIDGDRAMALPNFTDEPVQNLGLKGRDRVIDFTGILSAVSYDLMGCVQYAVSPPAKKDEGTSVAIARWADVGFVEIFHTGVRVMSAPTYGVVAGEPETKPSEFGHGPAHGKSPDRCL